MAEYFFSGSRNTFYPLILKDDYVASNTWPDDGILVDDTTFQEYTAPPPDGMQRGVLDGMPSWEEIPPLSQEQLVAQAGQQRSFLRKAADSEITWLQDAVDAGIATDEEAALLASWKNYRVLLMRVDVTKAPDIEWPNPPGV